MAAALAFLFTSVVSSLAAWVDSKEGQHQELNAVLMELETHYGMIKFKERLYGITYDGLRAKYADLIDRALLPEEAAGLRQPPARQVLSPDEFRQLIVAVAAEFRDGHLNILRQTSAMWTLGIRTAAIDGRLFVTGFMPEFFVQGQSPTPLRIGDEIIALDGKPVQQIADELMPYMQLATHSTREAAALESVVNRSHRRLLPMQTGAAARVTFARAGLPGVAPRTFTGVYHWLNTDDLREITAYMPPRARSESTGGSVTNRQPHGASTATMQPADEAYTFGTRGTESYFSAGLARLGLPTGSEVDIGLIVNEEIRRNKGRRSSILDLLRGRAGGAEPTVDALLEAEEQAGITQTHRALAALEPVTRLTARTVRYRGKNIGIIRIPDYSPETFQDVIHEIRWLAHVLSVMEQSTDGLIIDQLSNGGGYVFQVVQLAKLFANGDEMRGVTIDMRISESFLARAEAVLREHPDALRNGGNLLDLAQTQAAAGGQNFAEIFLSRKFVQQLRQRLAQGDRWTGPIPYMGTADHYTPGEFGRILGQEGKTYTKPVLLMNDSRSASGGDFFPAIMQSNGRAVVFGETSMGLGGPVYRSTQTPGTEMFARCTFGYCERSDGLPIENMGVVPDVPRWVTRQDLQDGFRTYAKDALETAAGLINGTPTEALREELSRRSRLNLPRKPSFQTLNALFTAMVPIATSDLSISEFTRAYTAFFEQIRGLNTSDLTTDDWGYLHLPLPQVLVNQDVLLGTLRSRRAVIERLEELKRLEPVRSSAEMVALVDVILTGLRRLGDVRFADCRGLLTPL
jgi:C-terminal processing protease CtpA/Prc